MKNKTNKRAAGKKRKKTKTKAKRLKASKPFMTGPATDGHTRQRQIGRVPDDLWTEYKDAAVASGLPFTYWAIGALDRELRRQKRISLAVMTARSKELAKRMKTAA